MANNTTTYGLTAGDSKVPLKKLEVRTEIQGFIALTNYTLTYENEEEKPIEASFVFPMDDASAVFRFEAEIQGRLIVAECQDKDQAKQTYDDAIEAGHSAFLLAESDESRDVFKCDVGNLPPKTTALVRLSYVTELDLQADATVLYMFPVTLFERYDLRDEDSQVTAHPRPSKRTKLDRAADGKIPYELDLQIKVLSSKNVLSVEFVDSRDEDEAGTKYGKEGTKYYALAKISGNYKWDHDISFKVSYNAPYEPHVVAEGGRENGEGILKHDMVMLNFFPNLEGEGTRFAKAELLFVMDRSGSMHGSSMQHAREALLECLKIIPKECIFNIVSFGSGHQLLFPQSREATDKHLKRAKNEVKQMEANMGGTEILQPMQAIITPSTLKVGYPRQVFLFTDGGVNNSDSVVSFIKENNSNTRVFTFGIGEGVSTSLVKKAAHAGKGTCSLVKDTRNLPQMAAQILRYAMQPNVDDVTITFTPSADVTFFPDVLPPIFNGERLIAYVVLRNVKKVGMNASLKGKINGRLFYHSLKFSFENTASEMAPVHRLAAKAAIKQMEEDESWTKSNKDEIIITSTAANVISKYTAFVGVDTEGARMEEEAEKRKVPVPQPSAQYSYKQNSSLQRSCLVLPGPRYGGGSFGSSMAEFYLAKNTKDIDPALCSILPSSSDIVENDTEMENSKDNEAEMENGKEYQPCRVTECIMFALWKKAAYYPVKSIVSSSYSKYEVTFQDGCKRNVRESDVISGAVLSVGDIIGLHNNDMDVYDTGVILEYLKEEDSFVVARHDGQVFWSNASNMMIPAKSAEKMKGRNMASLHHVNMCQLNEKGHNSTILTTADVSELREDGWITDDIVDFYASYLRQEVLSTDELRVTHIFPVEFSAQLFCDEFSTKRTREGNLFNLYDTVWPWLGQVNLKEKQVIFVPVFDQIHWYLIVVYIEDQENGRKRITFEIMDGFFRYLDQPQIWKLSGVLTMLAKEQDLEAEVTSIATQRDTPVQANENDCGVHMLQCLVQCYKDDLYPKPNRDWFSKGSNLREDIARLAMKLYWQQKK